MFPLGTVLLPGAYLPLHIFEERYRALVQDCLEGDGEFGVVLIERGSEVGGGETRTKVGTVARIVDARSFPDGRWALGAVGTRRIRVSRWLPDDPYPRAEVEDWPDPAPSPALGPELADLVTRLRRVLARATEMGEVVAPATVELDDDPVLASYQAAAAAPLGPSDRQSLLSAAGVKERVRELVALLAEEEAVLAQRLALESAMPEDPPALG
jgi:Lon protease-like protein